MILKSHCSYCKQRVDVSRVIRDPRGITRYFKCGHTQRVDYKLSSDFNSFESRDGAKLRAFQRDGAAFIVNSNYRALIADECGLGKTVQALAALKDKDKTLVICKSGLRMQWMRETFRWTGMHGQIIMAETDPVLPFGIYFISMDLLYRFKDMTAFAERFDFQTIILDECQAIKNHESKRTNAIRRLSSAVPNFIALSGTPIKNHAGEYFPVLNILRPDIFPTLAHYYADWTDTYYNGYSMKTGGLRDAERFKLFTQDFILRRTKAEVLPQLPKINRIPLFSELGKEVEREYQQTVNEFTDYYNSVEDSTTPLARHARTLAYLAKMRHITGKSKVKSVVNYIEEFLMSTDKKIVVFLHHKDVAAALLQQLTELCLSWESEYGTTPLELASRHSFQERQSIIDEFQRSRSRILIASTLAAGEGVDGIQNVCSDIIILERQWNPANEEQVEGRIERFGQLAENLTSTYPIAVGTIDEFFAELVERKRGYISNTLDQKEYIWNESSMIKELADVIAAKGGVRWG